MTKLMLPVAVNWRSTIVLLLLVIFLAGLSTLVLAQGSGADVRATVHNLSKFSKGTTPNPNTVKATDETQVCVFCHTPHGANSSAKTPLWNRASAPANTYTRYTSSSLDATTIADGFNAQPGGSSQLCLSCHDGMIALGNVNVLNGQSSPPTVAGLTGTMATLGAGSGSNTGFTRHIGTDLSNDHPISITYNNALALQDGEMRNLTTTSPSQRDTGTGTLIGVRERGYKPKLPLEATGTGGLGQVQCATCHDPHLPKEKFLRLNRFQANAAPGPIFNEANDQICIACHTKLAATWSQSAHANTTNANYTYKNNAAALRGFPPTGLFAKTVWEVGCLNCHDTHTASGSRRLLREGVGSGSSLASGLAQPGSTTRPLEKVSSIENTCYQCHTTPGNSETTGESILLGGALTATSGVPDIKTEFGRTYRMPMTTQDQNGTGNTNTEEIHDITDANFTETQAKLGRGNTMNRHVECTDCHNPHRVIKNSLFNGLGDSNRRTHVPNATIAGTAPGGSGGNIASGVLRGAWGVEPSYTAVGQNTVTVSGTGSSVTGTKWPENPTFTVKKGDPGTSTSTARTESYLTREYQLCFKCHSNYANGDTAASFPLLGNTGGGTPTTVSNSMTRYTNVAAEFAARATDPPSTGLDQGEATNAGTKCGGGDCAPVGSYPRGLGSGNNEINHRSWHPVVFPTGRDRAERAMGATGTINMRPPWDTNLGSQTMQCSDCHGEQNSYTQGSGPILTTVQGPHGSSTPFILKGTWNTSVTLPSPGSDTLCGKCHNPGANSSASGFGGDHIPDDKMGGEACMYCHIAVPHGWKNKAFLVNLRCVGQEVAGTTGDCENRGGTGYGSVTLTPYYVSSRLRISTWVRSGGWNSAACGGGDMEDICPRTGG